MRYNFDEIEMVAKGIYYHSETQLDFVRKIDELFSNDYDFGVVVTDYIQKHLPHIELVENIIIRVWAYHKPCDKCGKRGELYKKLNENGLFRNCPECL